jgi:hypothetical protein
MLVHCSSHFVDHLMVQLQLSSQTVVDPLKPEDRLLIKQTKGKHILFTFVHLTMIDFVYIW